MGYYDFLFAIQLRKILPWGDLLFVVTQLIKHSPSPLIPPGLISNSLEEIFDVFRNEYENC